MGAGTGGVTAERPTANWGHVYGTRKELITGLPCFRWGGGGGGEHRRVDALSQRGGGVRVAVGGGVGRREGGKWGRKWGKGVE